MSTTPPAAPSPGIPSGRLVLIVVGVIFGLGLLALVSVAAVGYFFASRVHVTTVRDADGRERTVKVDTPLGRLRVEKDDRVDPRSLGIPIYPGATIVRSDGGAKVDVDLDFVDTSFRILALEMETTDSTDQVIEFYRQAVADFVLSKKENGKVEFRWEKGKLKQVVGIVEKHGRTRISLANVGEPEAN